MKKKPIPQILLLTDQTLLSENSLTYLHLASSSFIPVTDEFDLLTIDPVFIANGDLDRTATVQKFTQIIRAIKPIIIGSIIPYYIVNLSNLLCYYSRGSYRFCRISNLQTKKIHPLFSSSTYILNDNH